MGPYGMEHEYGLTEGNIFHGELTLNQLFHVRPAAGSLTTGRRSVACASAAHPRIPAAG